MRSNQRLIQQGRSQLLAEDNFASRAAEQRWANRKQSRTPALIVIENEAMGRRTAPLSCVLKDTSSTGARLELSPTVAQRWGNSASGLPERFRLQIPSQLVEMDCRIAWYEGTEIGVQFASPVGMMKRAPRRQTSTKKQLRLSLSSLFAN